MASTYTANSGIELIASGEQSGTWGTTTNTNLSIIDRLVNGVGAIALAGTTHTLTTSDGVLSDGQYAVLVFGGAPSGTNTVTIAPNDGQHVYIVRNLSGESVILTQGSGGNVTVANGDTKLVYTDGTGAGAAVVDITADFAMSSVKITGGSITGITDLAVADGGTGASDASTARTNLGLAIGTNVQAYSAALSAIASLAVTDGNFIVGNGTTWVAESSATVRTSLGLGTMSSQDASSVTITGGSITGITDLAVAAGGTGASDAATARTNLGLAIGTDVQAYDAALQSIAGLTTSADQMIYTTALDTYATTGLTAAGRAILDDADASAQRTTLGLAIGTNVQAYDAELTAIAGLAVTDGNIIVGNGTTWVAESGATARTSLGLGTIATQDASSVTITGGTINSTAIGGSSAAAGAFTTVSASGDVTVADKIVHSGDTNTAIRFPAADTVTVETSGVERLKVDPSGDVTFTNGIIQTVYALSGTTPALNPNNGTIQTWTLSASSTPTDSLSSGESLTLMIDDGTAYTITWPSVTWKTDSGAAPTLNTTGFTAIILWKVGSVLYGARVGNA